MAVVTLSDDARLAHVARQREGLARWAPEVSHLRGVLGPDRNLARTRNAVAERALAQGAELLVFLDADCIPGPDLVRGYRAAAEQRPGDILAGPVTYLPEAPAGGYALARLPAITDPHPARPNPAPGEFVTAAPQEWDLFWSLSFAVRADTWSASGGFDESYVGYGGEDTDFAYRQRERGRRLTWVGGAHAYHQWHPVSSPPWEHLDDILTNAARFHSRWGVWPMAGWLDKFEEAGAIELVEGRYERIMPDRRADTTRRRPPRSP